MDQNHSPSGQTTSTLRRTIIFANTKLEDYERFRGIKIF